VEQRVCYGGPIGAMVDSLITEVDSKLKKTYAPSGHLAALANLKQKTQDNEKISGEVFDLVTGLLMDGIVGGMAGECVANRLCMVSAEEVGIDLQIKVPAEDPGPD